ncbi:MAG: hypothetical protein V2I48_02675 [Xanthomonadales bacterium]|jgi:hypothetical protein|nr:hypothetical protein [Xanthomonadales bacterium]
MQTKPMPRLLLLALPLFLLFSGLPADEETPPVFSQRGFLDDGRLLSGKSEKWKEQVDTLTRLGFNYVATRGTEPAGPVADYLREQGLAVKTAVFLDEATDDTPGKPSLHVMGGKSQKLWLGGLLTPPENSSLLWADGGSGKIVAWPSDGNELELGVFLHAGSAHNGPVQDPYPALIGGSIREAAKRGLTANVLVAGPGLEPFMLNLEAAAAAMKNPERFDGNAFYDAWASRHFGPEANVLTVKSLKLLHGAHEQVSGFGAISAKSMKILSDLQQEKPQGVDLNPVNDALRLARRSLELANQAGKKVPAAQSESFERQILVPASLYLENLELLESLCRLSGAWKIHRAMPPSPVSRQRVTGLLAEAQARSEKLNTHMAKGSAAGLSVTTELRLPLPEEIGALAKKFETRQI